MSKTYLLSNELLEVTIQSHGAELVRMKDKKTGKDYIWKGDPVFWGRHSPILFPLVGSLQNKQYTYQNKTYSMNQHGFARDMEFTCTSHTDDTIWFSLSDTEETRVVYPFTFTLEVGYHLSGRSLKVMWKVTNKGADDMHFSIGAHPAFVCPFLEGTRREEYFLRLKGNDTYTYRLITDKGLVKEERNRLNAKEGYIQLDEELFSKDALIFEGNQTKEVSILTPEKIPYVTIRSEAPLFGLWTPKGTHAPFLCIEPWYGRCDSESFHGSLEQREWGNALAPNEVFVVNYEILV